MAGHRAGRAGAWAALAVAAAAGCEATPDVWGGSAGPKVLVTFAPLYSFAKGVAGDDAQVLSLLSTKGPHDYTGTPRDALKLRNADLFLLNGLNLDDTFAKKLARASGNRSLKLVGLGDKLPKAVLLEGGECSCGHSHGDGHDHGHAHSHGDHDPHVWLGLPEAMRMVEAVRDELKALDPSHAAGYDERAAAYLAKLKTLHEEGRTLLKDKKDRRLVSFHGALAYFARSFDLEVVETVQAAPGVEPGASRLDKVIKTAADKKVRVVAMEPQYTDKNAGQTIVAELKRRGVDAEAVMLDPMETADPADLTVDFYEKRVRANLETLAKAMK